MSAVLVSVTVMLCVLISKVPLPVLVIADSLEMDSLAKVTSLSQLYPFRYTLFCSDINECTSNPCDNNAVCTDVHGSFVCACNNGYSGDGFTCQSKVVIVVTGVVLKKTEMYRHFLVHVGQEAQLWSGGRARSSGGRAVVTYIYEGSYQLHSSLVWASFLFAV